MKRGNLCRASFPLRTALVLTSESKRAESDTVTNVLSIHHIKVYGCIVNVSFRIYTKHLFSLAAFSVQRIILVGENTSSLHAGECTAS